MAISHCGKVFIVALHNIRGKCTCGKRLIIAPSPVTILGKGFVVPSLARGSLCPFSANTASSVHPAFLPSAMYTLSLVHSLYLISAYLCHWSSCSAIWLSSHPANDSIKIWLLHGSHFVFPLPSSFYCHRSLQYDILKKWLLHYQHCCCGIAINFIAGSLRLCDSQCDWSTFIKMLVVADTHVLSSCNEPLSLFPGIQCKHFDQRILCDGSRGHFLSQVLWYLYNCCGCSNNQLKKVGSCVARSCVSQLQSTVFCNTTTKKCYLCYCFLQYRFIAVIIAINSM